MTDLLQEPEGATLVPVDQRDRLLQSWITNRKDLNEAERDNIVKGAAWAPSRRGRNPADIATPDFAVKLHRRMFGDVWGWAGEYRKTETNIGIAPHLIQVHTPTMFDDVRYRIKEKNFPPDEIAVYMHNRLTFIHLFTNGNGRHARLMADLLIERMGGKAFSWGGGIPSTGGEELRAKYSAAQKVADNHDIAPLLAFARS
jgi:Fic-DOC domain mobile mystery protein B